MFKPLIYDGKEYSGYEINEEGEIRNKKTKRIRKQYISKTGYLVVSLTVGCEGKVKTIRVHKAVAETFIPNPDKLTVVHHIDGNRTNPSVNNLQWTTSKGNTQAHLRKCNEDMAFFNNRKLTWEDVKYIRQNPRKFSQRTLAKIFLVSRTTIINVQKNISYKDGY